MSQENVEIVRDAYEAWNSRDKYRLLNYVSEDFEFVNPDYAIESGTRRGRRGLAQALESFGAVFPEYAHEPHDLIDAGDNVLALVTFRARGHQGGVELHTDEQHLWTLGGGEVVRLEWFHDREAALEAAKLSEQDAHTDS
jgi:ketosteroid isomerase-like protein